MEFPDSDSKYRVYRSQFSPPKSGLNTEYTARNFSRNGLMWCLLYIWMDFNLTLMRQLMMLLQEVMVEWPNALLKEVAGEGGGKEGGKVIEEAKEGGAYDPT